MKHHAKHVLRLLLATTVLCLLITGLVGCSKPAATTSPPATKSPSTSSTASEVASVSEPAASGFTTGGNTAQGRFEIADKAMKAQAPDAVLLAVQTDDSPVTAYPSPTWDYMFASKASGKSYIVTVADGAASVSKALVVDPLTAAEWSQIPALTDWKADSDAAYEKASAAHVERFGTPAPKTYGLAMNLFITEAMAKQNAGAKPFIWKVAYLVDDNTARIIQVDAKTGEVLPASQ